MRGPRVLLGSVRIADTRRTGSGPWRPDATVILAVELLQCSNVVQDERWFGVSESSENFGDHGIDVPSCAHIEKGISHRSFKNFTYSSKAACSSGLTLPMGSDLAANRTLACCRPTSFT